MADNQYIRRVGAAFLASVFLFIFVLKASHHHSEVRAGGKAETHECASYNTDQTKCAICDFHLLKDGVSFGTDVTFAQSPLPAAFNVFQSSSFPEVAAQSADNKGPPALL